MSACTWGNCLILKLIDRIGIDAFTEGIKDEKNKSAGLLKDGSCMVLFVEYQYSDQIQSSDKTQTPTPKVKIE